jgi:hypothetical protein
MNLPRFMLVELFGRALGGLSGVEKAKHRLSTARIDERGSEATIFRADGTSWASAAFIRRRRRR